MAGPTDPFTPGPTADLTAGLPDMNTFENLRNQWSTFLDQPGARSALLQFGATLMQPPSFGDTGASQIGRALAAGGEAVSRGEALKSQESERESRAAAAEARAGQAGERIGVEYFRQRSISERNANLNVRAAQDAWRRDMQQLDATYKTRKQLWDASVLTNGPKAAGPEPQTPEAAGVKMSFDQWVQSPRGAGYATLPGVRELIQGFRGQPATAKSEPAAPAAESDEGA